MNRSSRFISGVGASYIGLVVNISYSLAIVPIGLYYLGKDQFGLWMLLVQVAGYLTFIEIGIFGAAARILIDYKDNKDGSAYAQVVTTAWAVLVVQAVLMAAASWLLTPLIVAAFNIPPPLHDIATYLFVFLGVSTALATCFKIFTAILYANQRVDLVVLLLALQLVLGLAIVCSLLGAGYGLPAIIWSFLFPVSATSILSWLACYRLRLLPVRMRIADVSLLKFRELFKFGTDLFLVNVSTQLLEASQLMIVSRTMGLPAAAVWSVSTKLFTLIFQLTGKIENTAVVFLSEMIVRGEREKLHSSFRQMYQLTGGLAVCGMLGAAAVNPYFVQAWAGSGVLWPAINNWLIAALLILNLLLRCHTDFAMHTKKVGLLRFLLFFESLAFVGLALWASPRFGFAGILTSAIICALIFRTGYAIRRTAAYFGVQAGIVAFRWVAFLAPVAAAMTVVASLIQVLIAPLSSSPLLQFFVSATVVSLAAIAILFTFGLPVPVRKLIWERLTIFHRSLPGGLRK
jgi:O-antigen/teichoic acid export membrane protein